MKQRDNNYHVQIKPEILFDVYNKFKSDYTPWVYAYLKLDYNNYIFRAPNRFYKIERKPICEFFGVNPATVSRAFAELISTGLMGKKGNEYRVLNDLTNPDFPHREGYREFIQINNNFCWDLVMRLKDRSSDTGEKDRSVIKALEVFYYLINKNGHALAGVSVLNSDETPKSISKNLHHDANYVKDYLGLLESAGQIEMNTGNISTVYGCGRCKPFKKNNVEAGLMRFEKRMIEDFESEPAADNDTKLIEPEKEVKKQPEPVTEREMIKYILMMSGDDEGKRNELSKMYHISDESLAEYLEAV